MKKIWLCTLLLVMFVSCSPKGPGFTETPVITASNEDEPCAFVWATKPLYEVTLELQEAMKLAGVKDVEVAAAAFGENCINTDGSIRGFGAMSVDINLTFNTPADGAADWQFLGERFEPAYLVLAGFKSANLPKPIQAIRIQLNTDSGIKF